MPTDETTIAEHEENPDLSYEVCVALIQKAREMILRCEGCDDPVEARAQFDLIRKLSVELNVQVKRISDPASRDTCLMQMNTLFQEGRRLAPTIPYICPRCDEPWLPAKEPDSPVCPVCKTEAQDSTA